MSPIGREPLPQLELTIFHLKVEKGGCIHIGGLLSVPSGVSDEVCRVEVAATAGIADVKTVTGGSLQPSKASALPVEYRMFVDFFITPASGASFEVAFGIRDESGTVRPMPVSFSAAAPLSEKTAAAYFCQSGWLLRSKPPHGFSVKPSTFLKHLVAEFRYSAWLLTHRVGLRNKACIPIRWATLVLRPLFLRRRIWLVMDRITCADDNGLAMFRYLVAHRREIGCRPVFFLSRKSHEWREVRKIGLTLPYSRILYRMATLFSEWTVASPSLKQVTRPLEACPDRYRGLANDHQVAFLQHGIIKDDLSEPLNRSVLDCSIFVTSAKGERDSIVNTPAYGHNGDAIVLTGMPRHDFLENRREKVIVFMPTWRENLIAGWDSKTGATIPSNDFQKSEYFQHLHALLSSQRLLDAASSLGFSIEFFPHPEVRPLAPQFVDDPRVRILPPGTKYRDVFARGALCVTDYSSAIFDFAWLGKPIAYYQPDDDNHYAKGYFKYELDGFGPVFHSAEELIDYLIDMMRRDCPMEEPYRTRAKTFFAFHDKNNCRRVTEAILAASYTH